jgi:hypothetical protein
MKQKLTLIFLIGIFISCDSNNKNKMISEDNFTWNVQLAGYNHSQADKKGETNYQDFLETFKTFPWMEQIEKANQNPDKAAPTIAVKDLKTGKDFWISMAGDKIDYGYIIGYIYPKEKKTLFGFGKMKEIRWLEMYNLEDKEKVEELIKLFFNRDYSSFESSIRKLHDFGQMEALDLAK